MMHFPMLRLLLLQFTLLLHASHAYLVPHRSPTSTALRSEPEIVSVPLAEGRNYPIYIGADLLNSDSETLASHAKGNDVLIVSNTKIAPLYLARVESIFKSAGKNTYTCILPDGEEVSQPTGDQPSNLHAHTTHNTQHTPPNPNSTRTCPP